jgi:hypothetical protein
MKRVVAVSGVLVGMLMVSSSEVMAASRIAYSCVEVSGQQQICVADPDGSNAAALTTFSNFEIPFDIDVSPDGLEVIAKVAGAGDAFLLRVPLDGSPVTQLTPAEDSSNYGGVAWFELPPPSVASLSPFNQTITVFLLGMIASALIMRGKAAKEAS